MIEEEKQTGTTKVGPEKMVEQDSEGHSKERTADVIVASKKIKTYFESIEAEVKRAYEIAGKARAKKLDPEDHVDIPVARNMAERVEGLMSIVTQDLVNSGMTDRILELEKKYGPGAWEVGLLIAEEVAKEKFCKFRDKREAMEVGIRCGMAYVTSGIVAAPLEGFIELKLKNRRDGGEYFSVCYAGPIRGAGGTAASVSVIIADYVRIKMGYKTFDPTENEVKRFITEIRDYHERVTNLQYFPSDEEIAFMVSHLPVEINGDPTEKLEVSNYKDNPRIQENRIRGGVCLVLAEGLCQKAPKIWKRLSKWGKDFDLEWQFLSEFLDLQKKIKARSKGDEEKDGKGAKILPNYTFISDTVAGRPILSYPMRAGGFRLRYGRCRNTGFSAAGIHPATQILLDNYIAVGTQLKVERPGKACSVVLCDTIDPPIVLLDDGEVIQVEGIEQAKQILPSVKKILFLGDLLFNYGDFEQNGHVLVPPGYCEEWYAKEFEAAIKECVPDGGANDVDSLAALAAEKTGLSSTLISSLLTKPFRPTPPTSAVIKLSKTFGIPIHPKYSYFWTVIKPDELLLFSAILKSTKIECDDAGEIIKAILPNNEQFKRILESIGIPHLVAQSEYIVIKKDHAQALLYSLGVTDTHVLPAADTLTTTVAENPGKSTLEIINILAPIWIRDRAGTFIGARMGRPEKAKMRELKGSPHCLFPVGDEGGVFRSFQTAIGHGVVTSDFPRYKCENCDTGTIYPICESCRKETRRIYECFKCGEMNTEDCPTHGPGRAYSRREIPIKTYFQSALSWLKMRQHPDLIKGVRGTSNADHTPENLAKGILRAKHEIHVNKDGTTRYDMSELPITHFRPCEVRTPIEKLSELGYTTDIHGKKLENPDQILEIFPQDIILPASPDTLDQKADDVVFRIGRFVDDLLEKFYGLPPFYNFQTKDDTIGELVIGLAPHISAGTVGRIIGYSKTQGMLCHPMFHAAMRRDCDGDEACIILLMDALLNFSRQFLPNRRGAKTMDAPLVLTTFIKPSEVDDQVLGLDVVWDYPKEFYEAALEYKKPSEFKIEQLGDRLDTENQYENMGYTHETADINIGVNCSAYKTIPSMKDKLKGQMILAERICSVDEGDVARLVIEKHFLKDIKGNLRKFSMQKFRCVKCNTKFRRPPLSGKCTTCSGKIILTITEGSVLKYLGPSISLAEKYNLPPYLKQVLEILRRRAEAVFGRDKDRQIGLGKWFDPDTAPQKGPTPQVGDTAPRALSELAEIK